MKLLFSEYEIEKRCSAQGKYILQWSTQLSSAGSDFQRIRKKYNKGKQEEVKKKYHKNEQNISRHY